MLPEDRIKIFLFLSGKAPDRVIHVFCQVNDFMGRVPLLSLINITGYQIGCIPTLQCRIQIRGQLVQAYLVDQIHPYSPFIFNIKSPD